MDAHHQSDAEGKMHVAGRGLEKEPEGEADADVAREVADSMAGGVVLVAVVGIVRHLVAFVVERPGKADKEVPT